MTLVTPVWALRKATCLLACFTLAIWSWPAAAGELRGDRRAVAAVERMLERLGGRDLWAGARTLHLEYRVWRTDPDEALTESAWRDLHWPNQRTELDSPSASMTWVFTPHSGWVLRDGELRALSDARHGSAVTFWAFDFYTLLHRFAVADEGLALEFRDPRRTLVRSVDGADWGWWEIDATGAPVKWGAASGGEALEYVNGPVRSFGAVAFPAWGAAVDGSRRFEYVIVEVSADPIPPERLQREVAGSPVPPAASFEGDLPRRAVFGFEVGPDGNGGCAPAAGSSATPRRPAPALRGPARAARPRRPVAWHVPCSEGGRRPDP